MEIPEELQPKSPAIEATKRGLRVIVLAIIPVIAASFNVVTGEISLNLPLVFSTAVIAFLTYLDSYLHETGIAPKGLTRF